MAARRAFRVLLLIAASGTLVLWLAGSSTAMPLEGNGARHVHAAVAPTVASVTPNTLGQGGRRILTIKGTGFQPGAVASVSGTGVTVPHTTFISSTKLTAKVRATVSAPTGPRDVTVTNPADGSGTCTGCLTIDPGPKPTSTNPDHALPGATLDVDILGSDFQDGAKSRFGANITVHSTTFVNSGKLTAHITVQADAVPGPRKVIVVNPDKGKGVCNCFTVTSPNTPPVPGSPSHNVLGNVRIQVPAPGVLDGATDPENDNISATPASGTSTHGGDFTVSADGSYTYNPPAGYEGSDDFPFQICDDGTPSMCANGSVSLTVSGMIWFIDSSQGSNGDGRLTSPFNCLTGTGCFAALNDGVGSHPATGDNAFLYSGNYTGGVTLLNNQKLIGQGASASLATVAGVTVPTDSDSLPTTGGTNPAITTVAASTNGVTLGSGNTLRGFDIGNTTGSKISGSSFGTLTASEMTLSGTGQALNLSTGTANATFDAVSSSSSPAEGIKLATVGGTLTANGGTLTDATNADVDINGGAGTFTYKGNISDDLGRLVSIANTTGGTKDFQGSITDLDNGTGTGISLSSNTGGTITFEGGLTLSTGANAAFTATGGGTIVATQNNTSIVNKLTTTTGKALDVENTTIGASGLTFRSISANGPTNGIVLSSTGSSGGLSVTGTGSTTQGGDASGGTIQNTTGAGISLTTTQSPSFNDMTVTNTANAPGIDGTDVTNFSFTNGTVSNSGLTSQSAFDSNIAFNDNGATIDNLDGTVTITNNVLSNAFQFGVDILNNSGTISDLNISSNAITSSTLASQSAGSGIRAQALGSASGAASVTKGEINSNTIHNFPNGAGIVIQGGNVTSGSAPAGTFGTDTTTHVVQIKSNLISGQSSANPMSTNCILLTMPGNGSGFFDVSSNGTVANPLGNNKGNCVSINATGAYTLTANVSGNVVSPGTGQNSGAFGISGGTDRQVLADASTSDSAVMNLTANNNTVSNVQGIGIRFLANSQGTLNAKIQNNNVGTPNTPSGPAEPGIRVDSGTSAGTAIDTNVCLDISGNTTSGSTFSGTTFPGIGLRKQGTVQTTNDFGIVGLSPSPATAAQTESFVSGNNAGSASGTFGTGGTAVISGSNFQSCTLSF